MLIFRVVIGLAENSVMKVKFDISITRDIITLGTEFKSFVKKGIVFDARKTTKEYDAKEDDEDDNYYWILLFVHIPLEELYKDYTGPKERFFDATFQLSPNSFFKYARTLTGKPITNDSFENQTVDPVSIGYKRDVEF